MIFNIFKLTQEDIESDPNYIKANNFAKSFVPQANVPYKWTYDYALRTFQAADDNFKALNAKAENMVRYVGPGSGILGIGLGFLSVKDGTTDKYVIVSLVIGVLLIVLSIISALRALSPMLYNLGHPVEEIVRCADLQKDEEKSLGQVAAWLGIAIVARMLASRKRAKALRWCHNFFVAGITAFLIAGVLVLSGRIWQ